MWVTNCVGLELCCLVVNCTVTKEIVTMKWWLNPDRFDRSS